jgi:hypothetical protein
VTHVLFCDYGTQTNSDSYDEEVEDISLDESSGDTSTSEAEITDSDLDSSADTETLQ